MEYKIGRSQATPVDNAISQACQTMTQAKFVWFTTTVAAFAETSQKMQARFPHSIVMGTTSIAAFSNEGIFHDTLEVLAIESGIECVGNVLEEADCCPLKYVERVQEAVRQLGTHRADDCPRSQIPAVFDQRDAAGRLPQHPDPQPEGALGNGLPRYQSGDPFRDPTSEAQDSS